MLDALETLNKQGVFVAWAPSLRCPAIWIATHSVLVINAAAGAATIMAVLKEMADFLSL